MHILCVDTCSRLDCQIGVSSAVFLTEKRGFLTATLESLDQTRFLER